MKTGAEARAPDFKVELLTSSDDGHKFWLGNLNISIAIAWRRVKVQRPGPQASRAAAGDAACVRDVSRLSEVGGLPGQRWTQPRDAVGVQAAGVDDLIVQRHELIARSSGQRVKGPPSSVDLRLIRK